MSTYKIYRLGLLIMVLCIQFRSFSQIENPKIEIVSSNKEIVSEKGDRLNVEYGKISVPETRNDLNSRKIVLAYYRIKSRSENPISPIFLLAGGPGGSYLNAMDKEELFNEARFYSLFADVVIFDQRGAGLSSPNLKCQGEEIIPLDEELTIDNFKRVIRLQAEKCNSYWTEKGVDLKSYNTDESANDINDLRQAMGYDKIILVGGSYGSHLGLHTMRKYPEIVARAIFHGIEGPDHTWDVPSYRWNTLKRIAQRIESSDYYGDKIPKKGLLWALENAIRRLEEYPDVVVLRKGDRQLKVRVNEFVAQRISSFKAGNRNRPLDWPDMILDMYEGAYDFVASAALQFHRVKSPHAMSNVMDFASGISERRKHLITEDTLNKILGDINYGYSWREDIWDYKDLGENFRLNVASDIPVLLIHGTWDVSTPIENAFEVNTHLKNSHLIKVIEGSHNVLYELFKYNKAFPPIVKAFLKDEKIEYPEELLLPEIVFPKKVSKHQENLWEACISGDLEKLKMSITNGGDIEELDTRTRKSGRRALNWASYYGHLDIVKFLIENGAKINAQNLTGFTALHHAIENNQFEILKFLVKNGADINIATNKDIAPITLAIKKKNDMMIDFLKQL